MQAEPSRLAMEPVRLIIWDLDGVFWHGSLAEEGAVARPEMVRLIIELARRGIMSAVCSKNDFARAQAELQAQGAWEYLIFPSIDWTPKGARIASLLQAVQLRPQSALFIDDLPANLAEARAMVPGLQTAGPDLIASMLDHPLFAGQPDPELTRLAHYRLMQGRQTVAAQTGGDNLAFLRASNIRVQIDYDVERSLDRAIELINRTNQLNFTKSRLSENSEQARVQLRETLARFDVFAGLVRAVDDYGDYGIVGFYCGSYAPGTRTLLHFCFSCRVMNMGLEACIYQRIGSPALTIAGEVAGDPFAPGPFDWIALQDGAARSAPAVAAPALAPAQPSAVAPARLVDRLILRGGCDLQAMAHHLAPCARVMHEELNLRRLNRPFRIDNMMLLPPIFDEPSAEIRAAMEAIGYQQGDWTSALARLRPGERQVWIFSFWTDDFAQLYKHHRLDVALPFLSEGDPSATRDLTSCTAEEMRRIMSVDQNFRAWEALKRDFWCIGPVFDGLVQLAITRMMAQAAAQEAMVIIMLAPTSWCHRLDLPPLDRPQAARVNAALRAAAPAARFVDMQDFATPGAAYPDMLHYDRIVYQRAAAHIAELIAGRFGG